MKSVFAKLMSMDEATWERHANPWSVWTRVVSGLQLRLTAIWSARPLGYWSGLYIFAVGVWVWLNPRLFSVPSKTGNWGSKFTFGERMWLNISELSIPGRH